MILTGLPHSEISGSTFATNYPELFAGDRVLLRHSAPRHPPCALCSLTYKPASSPVIDRLDAIDMNGDRYVSSSTKLAVLSCLLQLLRCTTRSGARTKNRSCVCRNEGFRLNDLRDGHTPGGSGAGTINGRASVAVPQSPGPVRRPDSARWSRGDSNS